MLDLCRGGFRGLRSWDPRRIEFRPESREFTCEVICPASLLFERLLLLDLRLDGLHGFRNCDPRHVEFRPKEGKLTRKVVCSVSLLLERLRLSDPHLNGLGSFLAYEPRRIEFRPEGRKFTRKGVCPILLLSLLDPRRFRGRLDGIELCSEGRGKRTCKGLNPVPFLLLFKGLLLLRCWSGFRGLHGCALRCVGKLNESQPTCGIVDGLTPALENLPLDRHRLGNQRDQQGFVSNGVGPRGPRDYSSLFGGCGESLRADCAFTAQSILRSSSEKPQNTSSHSRGTRNGSACYA